MSRFAKNIFGICIAAVALSGGVAFATAGTKEFSVLHTFCAKQNCSDGEEPIGSLVADTLGNLYGTTSNGGSTNCFEGCGTVFRLGTDGSYKVLYTFCSENASCPDGYMPLSPLIFDSSGDLIGTTLEGGAQDDGGTVFKLTPKGKETVLYNFCNKAGCADGQGPAGTIVMDRKGNLYGETTSGGSTGGEDGTIFKLSPDGKEKALYSFCAQDGCVDGLNPWGGLVMDRDGNLYGTTKNGGAHLDACSYVDVDFCGTVFKMSPNGKETVLYSFCAKEYCSDGEGPLWGVILDGDGNLYGTTLTGGNLNPNCENFGGGSEGGCGVVFEVHPDSTEKVLYAFCGRANCTDGDFPSSGVTLKAGKDGTMIYGVAEFGGPEGEYGEGVLYSLSGGTETVLHAFCGIPDCLDGTYPIGDLLVDGRSLIGATWLGGKYNQGTVFRFSE